jgi:hypothetical protein
MGSTLGVGLLPIVYGALLAMLLVGQARADCYYEYNGGCVVLSVPPVQGGCLAYYTTIISNVSPYADLDACYDGFYSECICALFAPTTSCLNFADFTAAVNPPIEVCPEIWVAVGTGIVTLIGDQSCNVPAVAFAEGPTDVFPNGCPGIEAAGPSTGVCCSTLCDQTC